MQDRFKFRAWNKLSNEMKDVISLNINHSFPDCSNVILETDSFNHITPNNKPVQCANGLNNVILMQSTGLKDKNGKLIYEGDIVRLFGNINGSDINNIHTVKFGDFAMYDFDFQEDFEKGSTAVYGWYLGGLKIPVPLSISLDTSGLKLEIIGNIYENPELLEVK